MRDKRLTHVEKTKTEHFILSDRVLCYFFRPTGLKPHTKPLQRFTIQLHYKMNITTIFNVCERLFDELIKELLAKKFDIVSASYKTVDGRKIRVRKAHLRKRKR